MAQNANSLMVIIKYITRTIRISSINLNSVSLSLKRIFVRMEDVVCLFMKQGNSKKYISITTLSYWKH